MEADADRGKYADNECPNNGFMSVYLLVINIKSLETRKNSCPLPIRTLITAPICEWNKAVF
jgi:hypothetical protein